MAIEKDIAIHSSSGVRSCVSYIENPDKCTLSDNRGNIETLLDYTQNTEKTSIEDTGDVLTSGILCDPEHAAEQFELTAKAYRKHTPCGTGRGSGGTKEIRDRKTGEVRRVHKESIEAYHIIQSFPADDSNDPKLIHEIGKEFASTVFPGHQCVVSTHMNTDHLHNHIVVCAYNTNGRKKVCLNKNFRYQMRRVNDELSIKHGMSILLESKNRYQVQHRMNEHPAVVAKKSFKEEIRLDIGKALDKDFITSWSDFTIYMETLGYKLRQTDNHVTYIRSRTDPEGNEHTYRCRDIRLGDKYMRTTICNEKGWEYQGEKQQTRYMQHLRNCYSINSCAEDRMYVSERTGRLFLNVGLYDEEGRKRTLIELAILGAIRIIQYFWQRHIDKMDSPQDPKERPETHMSPDNKLLIMLEALEIARTLRIENKNHLKMRKNEIGKRISVHASEIFPLEAKANNLIKEYDNAISLSDTVKASEHANAFHEISREFASMRREMEALKNEYALLSKLSRALDLSHDHRFVLGPGAYLSDYPKCLRIDNRKQTGPEKDIKTEHSTAKSNTPTHFIHSSLDIGHGL